MLLITAVWLMFLLASSSITLLIAPVIGREFSVLVSVARTLAGIAIFGIWVYAWEKTAEFWLYRILLKEDEP